MDPLGKHWEIGTSRKRMAKLQNKCQRLLGSSARKRIMSCIYVTISWYLHEIVQTTIRWSLNWSPKKTCDFFFRVGMNMPNIEAAFLPPKLPNFSPINLETHRHLPSHLFQSSSLLGLFAASMDIRKILKCIGSVGIFWYFLNEKRGEGIYETEGYPLVNQHSNQHIA